MSTFIYRTDTHQFLKSYDPVTDTVDWTPTRDDAYAYPDANAALAGYTTQSIVEPFHSDGSERRPLTAIPVTFVYGTDPTPTPSTHGPEPTLAATEEPMEPV
jgi:hypothetical protein